MSITLSLLVWSSAVFALYLGVQAILFQLEYGIKFGAGPCDDKGPAKGAMLGRSERALRNFLETYPVFIALSAAIVFADKASGITEWGGILYLLCRVLYLPAYLGGVPYLRSMIWLIAMLGLASMFFGVAF